METPATGWRALANTRSGGAEDGEGNLKRRYPDQPGEEGMEGRDGADRREEGEKKERKEGQVWGREEEE